MTSGKVLLSIVTISGGETVIQQPFTIKCENVSRQAPCPNIVIIDAQLYITLISRLDISTCHLHFPSPSTELSASVGGETILFMPGRRVERGGRVSRLYLIRPRHAVRGRASNEGLHEGS